MGDKKKRIQTTTIGIFVLMIGIFYVYNSVVSAGTIQFNNDITAYKILIQEDDKTHIAYELQAIPLMKENIARDYRRDFIATVIIAVDRNQVDDRIEGWNCLRNGDYKVYFGYRGRFSNIEFGYVLLAMSAGLDLSDNDYTNSMHLMKELHSSGRLTTNNLSDAPIAILFDYQAAQMIQNGRNLEIIVPVEGTLSYPVGLMTTDAVQLPEVNPSDLVATGFRLPDGEADISIYPDATYYLPVQNAVLSNESGTALVKAIATFRRQVLGERRYSPANGMENLLFYLIFIIVIVIWSGLLFLRISNKTLQKYLLTISFLLLMWMFVRILRLVLLDGLVDRLFWYLYYIPLIFLPTILFWIGQIITQNDEKSYQKLLKKGIFIISFLLTVLVLTNDLHQLAFHFYNGMEGNNYDLYYRNSWVYYIVFSWSLLLIFSFVAMVVRYKTDSTAKRAGPLLVIVFLSAIYFAGYAYGVKVLRESEFSIIYGIMSLLFLEACFQSRLIPNNTKLGQLLNKAPIDLHIFTDRMAIEYQTNCSTELPPELINHIRHSPLYNDNPLGIGLSNNDSTLYSVYRINGGYSVFAKHLDSVIKLRAALTDQNQKIQVQNNILARTHSIKSEIARLKMQQELFSRIDDVLKDRVNRINIILSVLSGGERDREENTTQKQLAIIKILVNYCKRRGNLALLEANDEFCQTSSLALWLQESIWEANAKGIDGLVTESGNRLIPSTLAAMLYDCFQQIIENSIKYSSVVLLVNLTVKENQLTLRINIETSPDVDLASYSPDEELCNPLNLIGGSYDIYEQDKGLTIEISVPIGGENCD
jgi:hypothetical protein